MTTVVVNLSSDMRTAAPLTQGGLLLSRQLGARWGSVACGIACGGYYVGVIMGEAEPSYPSVMADLAGVAWAVPAAPLCILVIRNQQCPLVKESPRLLLHQCGRPPTTMNAMVGEL